MNKTRLKYPEWICVVCGNKYGKPRTEFSCWHIGKCGWCGKKNVPVTQPRDYGYPKFKGVKP